MIRHIARVLMWAAVFYISLMIAALVVILVAEAARLHP